MLDHALDYARRGWHVFPLEVRGKRPLTKRGLLDATTDETQIRAWWQRWPDANIGVRTGSISGLVVLDVDPDHGGDASILRLIEEHGAIPETVASITGGGGRHYLFAHPGGIEIRNTAGKLGRGLDTRGDGGYIVAAPSVHPSGTPYAWEDFDLALADAPEWLVAPTKAKTHDEREPVEPVVAPEGSATPYAEKILDYACRELASTPEGQRNDVLNAKAWKLGRLIGGGQIDETLAVEALTDAARMSGLDDAEIRSTMKSGMDAGKLDPQTPFRMRTHDAHGRPFPERDLTELGNAETLIDWFGDSIMFVPRRDVWFVWTGTEWEQDFTGEVVRMAKEVAQSFKGRAAEETDDEKAKALRKWWNRSTTHAAITNMVKLAQTEEIVVCPPEYLDQNPWLLNVRNGTIDLRTGDLLSHQETKRERLTYTAPVEYDADARCDRWERFLADSLADDETGAPDDELLAFVRRAVGYTLSGDLREETFAFVHGETRTGKSTFMDAVSSMLGAYAKKADFETFLRRRDVGGPRSDLARLAGSRLVYSIEVEDGKTLAEAVLKAIAGGDKMTVAHKHEKDFEFQPTFTLWLVANHFPRVQHSDDAMWRRIMVVPMNRQVPPEKVDRTLKTYLRSDLDARKAVLAWAVRGCLEWQADGLAIPDRVIAATEEYREEMDPLGEFIEDRCRLDADDPECWIGAGLLRETYDTYCREQGIRFTLSLKAWGEILRDHGCREERRRVNGNRVRIWTGITLRPEP